MKQSDFTSLIQAMFRSAGKLTLFVVVSIVLLLAIKQLTDPVLKEAQQKKRLDTFAQVLPAHLYNNDPLSDTRLVRDAQALQKLGREEPVTVYRARKNGQPVGVILTATAPDGYSGEITVLIGVLADGRISGVRILEHRETPGLGDKIELDKSPWILEFNGRSLRDDNDPRWGVKKDGGDFDQFTGATITPRAVVEAVKNALVFVNRQGKRLYE